VGTLPNALIADIAFIIGSFYTHSEIDNLFMRRGAPGEIPPGSKLRKTEAWLMIANETPSFDMVSLVGGLLEDLMDREARGADRPKIERAQADVRRVLARHALSYQRGGIILGATLSTPSRSLEDLIRQGNLGELQKEFNRALANVQADPPAAITAACAMLETLFKVVIADEGLELPSDLSVLPLWRVVQRHLDLDPGKASDPHLRQVLQGLTSSIQGVAGLRSNLGSARGRGPDAPTVEPRHARLAVHAAHTVVLFVLESGTLDGGSP
jgi:hypothetical protein